MIKKMKLKIFLIIFFLLTLISTITISYNAYKSYKTTIRGIILYVENSNNTKKNNEDIYRFRVKDSKIMYGNSDDEKLKEYAMQVVDKKSKEGIIGNYIYKNSSLSEDKKRKCYCFN